MRSLEELTSELAIRQSVASGCGKTPGMGETNRKYLWYKQGNVRDSYKE